MNRGADNAKSVPRQRRPKLREIYAAIGIEDDGDYSDDSTDEDYIVKEEDDDEEEGDFSVLGSDTDRSSAATHKHLAKNITTKQTDTTQAEAGDVLKMDATRMKHSPHLMQSSPLGRPSKKRKVGDTSKFTDDIGEDTKTAIPANSSAEYTPRNRSSKHLDEVNAMDDSEDEIVNMVPPFAPDTSFSSWDAFDKQFKIYMRKYNLQFRVRSSETTVKSNARCEEQLPTEFKYTHRIYRCTHGVSQKSRPKGHRNRKQRYCKCKARLTPYVRHVAGTKYGIVIHNQNHTHSHPTSTTQASLYMKTSTLPLDDEDVEDVKTLADARVSSTHITNFLNVRIGSKVTPQQTRNLIRSIMGQDSAQDRLKDMLHALRQLDGSDVLVIQDQMDVTCGAVTQTKVQKMMFERWGENLTMDFTHGTNNLGYHLGSLVVTTCTGRGFPVVDFICLNEYAVTIKRILEYFKDKNPMWEHVETVVIDKDFVEWKVLLECFPNARILLCQFHAISYWKKVMKRPGYRIKSADNEDLLILMTKLLYCRTQDAYDSGYATFKEYCKSNKKQAFFAYFEKNWNSCRTMWSNYARGKHFTAGNTTTNRIESNWKYLKMLLGHKTRIDQTIAGLLQHQMIIARQIVTEIGKQHASSRLPKTVPAFLRAVARRTAAHVFDKVKQQWEKFVNREETTTCERESCVSKWKVYYAHQTYECDDVDWACTCLFYTSHHLPCCHLMHVANKGHGFAKLPGMSIHERWSTFEALDVKEEIASAIDELQPIVNMSKLKLPKSKSRLPVETLDSSVVFNEKRSIRLSTESAKEVAFVRLRRNERANPVVLTSAEKYSYAKAMLEPLMQHLSELSSIDFYQELKAWKDTIDSGLGGGGNDTSIKEESCEDGGNEPEDDFILDPADAMATASIMEALENADRGMDITDESSDNEDVPPTQPTRAEVDGLTRLGDHQHTGVSPDLAKTSEKGEKDCVTQPDTPVPLAPVAPRQVDIINVPKPKKQGRSRSNPKQLRQTKLTAGAIRLAVHKYPSDLAVQLDQFVIWARNTPNVKAVADMIGKYPVQFEDAYLRSRTIECGWEAMRPATYMHPFVIPADLTRSLEAAIKTAKNEQREPDPLEDRIKSQGVVLDMVASIDPKLWKMSGRYVGALSTFYAIKMRARSWFDDRKWLEQDWRKIGSDVDLFGEETGTAGLSGNAVCNRHRIIANEVISKFASSRLSSQFGTQSRKGLISFENVVGGVCRGWLNDSPIDFCMESLVDAEKHCYVLSSLTGAVGWPKTPTKPIASVKFIIHPCNLKRNHWGVIILRLNYVKATDKLRVQAYFYEPLIDDEYREEMKFVWEGIVNDKNETVKEGLPRFIERWCQASAPNTKLSLGPIEWIDTPQQPDFSSCGVFVVAQAYAYATNNLRFQLNNVTKNDVLVMRLRMLWVIMCKSRELRMSRATADTVKDIHEALVGQLKQ